MKKFFSKATTMLLVGVMCVGICPVITFAGTSSEQASELIRLVYGSSGNEMAEDEEFMESVMQSPGHLSLDIPDAEIEEGETASIRVKLTDAGWTSDSEALRTDKFEWASDSPAATVNSSGVVTGQSEGTATITAKNTSAGLSASTKVTVHAAEKEPDEDIMVLSEKGRTAEPESNADANTNTVADANTETVAGANTETVAGANTETVADANTDTVADANTDAAADANADAAPEITDEEEANKEQANDENKFSFGLISRKKDDREAVNPDEPDPAEGTEDPDAEAYAATGEEADGEEADEAVTAVVTPQLKMDPDSVTLQAGDAYTLSPSMIWYSAEDPDGQAAEFTFVESEMSCSGYLITADGEQEALSSEEIAGLIACTYPDATTLEITTGTLADGYVGAVITINLMTTGNTVWDESDPAGTWNLTTEFRVILNQNNTGEEEAVPLAGGDDSGDDAEGTGDTVIAIGNGDRIDNSTTTGDINSGNEFVINNTTNNNNSTNTGSVNWVQNNVRFSDGNIRFVDHGRHHGPVRRYRENHGKPAPTPTSSTTKSTVNPKTGDTSSSLTLAYTLLVSGACAGIAGLLIYRRRRA